MSNEATITLGEAFNTETEYYDSYWSEEVDLSNYGCFKSVYLIHYVESLGGGMYKDRGVIFKVDDFFEAVAFCSLLNERAKGGNK